MKTQTENKLIADKMYSTYWWIITLDHQHPENYNENVKEITGYSKFQGHDEAQDKRQMLMRKCVMLAQHGYIQRCKRIEVYARDPREAIINKKTSMLLFTMYPKDFRLEPEYLKIYVWVKFLNDFYLAMRNGGDVTYLLPKPKATFSKDEFFDVSKHTFRTSAHLQTYCAKMVRNGHPFDQVTGFYHKYIEKFPNLTANAH